MFDKVPKDWRIGQTIFNFLWWLNKKKGYAKEIVGFSMTSDSRMADPFHINDKELEELYEEFLKEHE